MSLTNPNTPVSQQDLQDFYHKILPYISGGGDDIQVSTMPTASAELEDSIVQYVGETDANYTNGYFYQCVEESGLYSWTAKNVQEGGGGSSYTAGDGIVIDNDEISTKQSVSGDMDEIVDSLPSGGTGVLLKNAFNRGDLYSTDEKMIGQWIDGKPLYQATLHYDGVAITPNTQIFNTQMSALNIESVLKVSARFYNNYNSSGVWECEYYMDNNDKIQTILTPNYVYLMYGTSYRSLTKVDYTIQYTKTTDSAVSIGEETEYSTTEKIIGTWIDGKPVYQKTFQKTVSDESSIVFNAIGATVDTVVNIQAVLKNDGQNVTFPFMNDALSGKVALVVNDNSISSNKNQFFCYAHNIAVVGKPYTLTLQYTKTT